MPAKTFNCAICGAEVSKPKSFALEDGRRACRTHAAAQKAHEQREADKAKQAEQEQKKREAKAAARHRQEEKMAGIYKPVCFVCGAEGLYPIAYLARLVQLEQLELLELQPVVSLLPPLLRCSLADNAKIRFVDRDAYMAAKLVGQFVACPTCLKKHNIRLLRQEP